MEDLVKKGRSVGILVILISRRPPGDALPTFIRDVCPVGLSFAQKTVEAAVAALGDDIRNWPDANPVDLAGPRLRGRRRMAMQGRPGFTRIRTPYVSDADAARIAEDTSHLTADPPTCPGRPPRRPRPPLLLTKHDPAARQSRSCLTQRPIPARLERR